jgi:hypothetical protein
MKHKYRAKATTVDGIAFASKGEARRYGELKLLERAGKIASLELQPGFQLQPKFRDAAGASHRAITYVADFRYYDEEIAAWVVEDFKGFETPVFKLKKKLFLFAYPEYVFRVTK